MLNGLTFPIPVEKILVHRSKLVANKLASVGNTFYIFFFQRSLQAAPDAGKNSFCSLRLRFDFLPSALMPTWVLKDFGTPEFKHDRCDVFPTGTFPLPNFPTLM